MGVKHISEVTRRDIATLFVDGYYDYSIYWPDSKDSSPDDAKIFYPYCGRLTEVEFLKRLYPIDKMPSTDSRYPNAEGDIWQHTVNNDDWEYGWIFQDSRFGLLDGDDVILLNFLCAVFHPAYRKEDGSDNYLDIVQNISRNFTDMKLMRDRVVNKTYCEPLPQLQVRNEVN